MIADDFTEAARAEAERRHYPRYGQAVVVEVIAATAFANGAEWGREQALAQEPTDTGPHELDESAPIRNLGYYRSSARCKCGYEVIWGEHDGDAGLDEAWRVHLMRSAVHAVRAARRDEEKR